MKYFLAIALLGASLSAVAASVKVTSFRYVRTSTDTVSALAELCGVVTESTTSPTFLKILIDARNNPATYSAVADVDGKFCAAVITFRGTADVTIMGQPKVTKAVIQ